MAIEIEIPKDITKYEAKLIGPLTTRQTVCVILGLPIAVLVFNVVKAFLTQEMSIFISILVASPFLLCGWYKPYGMPFEKFVKSVFISIVVAPKNRKYITKNIYEELNKIDETTSKENKSKSNIPSIPKTNKKKETEKKSNIVSYE